MRRVLPIAAALGALTLTAPAAALANHGHHHHKAKHSAHHAKVHFRHLGAASTSSTTGTVTPAGTSATPPTAPTTPPAPEKAGTVASYTGGVLTLTLTDGSSVSGKVTANTRIECVSATTPPPTVGGKGDENGAPGDDNGPGDDQSGDASQGAPGNQEPGGDQGNQTQGTTSPQVHGGDDGNDGGDGGDGQGTPTGTPVASEPPCDSSALLAGATVREAELRIGPGGSEFESIELVR